MTASNSFQDFHRLFHFHPDRSFHPHIPCLPFVSLCCIGWYSPAVGFLLLPRVRSRRLLRFTYIDRWLWLPKENLEEKGFGVEGGYFFNIYGIGTLLWRYSFLFYTYDCLFMYITQMVFVCSLSARFRISR